jgi:hypothetical protein
MWSPASGSGRDIVVGADRDGSHSADHRAGGRLRTSSLPAAIPRTDCAVSGCSDFDDGRRRGSGPALDLASHDRDRRGTPRSPRRGGVTPAAPSSARRRPRPPPATSQPTSRSVIPPGPQVRRAAIGSAPRPGRQPAPDADGWSVSEALGELGTGRVVGIGRDGVYLLAAQFILHLASSSRSRCGCRHRCWPSTSGGGRSVSALRRRRPTAAGRLGCR